MQFEINNIGDDGIKMKNYVPAIENAGITIKRKKDSKGFNPNEYKFYVNLEDLNQLVALSKAVNCAIILEKTTTLTIVDGYLG